jgi:hypothetical protein
MAENPFTFPPEPGISSRFNIWREYVLQIVRL